MAVAETRQDAVQGARSAQGWWTFAGALVSLSTLKQMRTRLRLHRASQRASALSFQTLLSLVPLVAVGFAALRALGGAEVQEIALRNIAERYVPDATSGMVERLAPLVTGLSFQAIGLLGTLALIPLMAALIDALELALSDVFETPRRRRWWRMAALAGLLALAPMATLLTARYAPWQTLDSAALLGPTPLTFLLLYVVFQTVPATRVHHRASLAGALLTALLLGMARLGFGVYANHLSHSLHILWGAVATFPLALVWLWLTWYAVLLGAEWAAVLQRTLDRMDRPERSHARRPRDGRLRRRLRAGRVPHRN